MNHIFWSGIDNYNIERTKINSCLFHGTTNTPFLATPTGDKNGQYPLTDGNNRLTAPTATKNQLKGRVVLEDGTARVTVRINRHISTTGTLMSIIEKVRLTVITPNNAGALRVVLDTMDTYFDIFSTNEADASIIEWEVTGV